MAEQILRLQSVTRRTGLSRSTIYAKISRGEFSRPILLGQRAVGWLEREVERWIQDAIATRDVPKDGGKTLVKRR